MATNFDAFQTVDEQTFAAWADGKLTPQEEQAFMAELDDNPGLAELFEAYDQIEADYEQMVEQGYTLPEELQHDFDLPEVSLPLGYGPVFDDDAEPEPYDYYPDEGPHPDAGHSDADDPQADDTDNWDSTDTLADTPDDDFDCMPL
ncbi:MAG: hypothetical protein ACI3YD_03685 [Alloprevotella sp.]